MAATESIKSKRDENWRSDEIKELISLYGDKFADLESISVKKPIYEWISSQLAQRVIFKRYIQVMRKISWLRLEYRKQSPGPTGGAPSKWEFYPDMHKILHERPSLNPAVAETSKIGLDDDSTIFSTDSRPSTPSSSENVETDVETFSDTTEESNNLQKRKRKSAGTPDVVKIAKESFEFMKAEANKRQEMRAELKNFNDQILLHFDRMATASERFVDIMLNTTNNS